MEDEKDRTDGLEEKKEELPVEERRDSLLKELKRQTDRLLNIGYRAHCTVKNLNQKYTRSRPKKKMAKRRFEGISTDSVFVGSSDIVAQGAVTGIAAPAWEPHKKLLGDLTQEATEAVDEVNNIMMEMVELLRGVGEMDLAFENLSLTFTLDDAGVDGVGGAAALERDIYSIVEMLTRRQQDIDVMFNKFEGRGIK